MTRAVAVLRWHGIVGMPDPLEPVGLGRKRRCGLYLELASAQVGNTRRTAHGSWNIIVSLLLIPGSD